MLPNLFGKKPAPPVDPAALRRIEQIGYKVTEQGTVACATCGGYCGQCGDDYSPSSVDAFLEREASRTR